MNPLRVLVIDDEPAVRQIIAEHVKRAGYNVDQAGGAAEAASKLVRGDVDIALCDIQMPDGNGLDLVKSIRESGIDTTFIMVTAFATMETAIEALRAGATDFITKPLRTEELLHRLLQVASLRLLHGRFFAVPSGCLFLSLLLQPCISGWIFNFLLQFRLLFT